MKKYLSSKVTSSVDNSQVERSKRRFEKCKQIVKDKRKQLGVECPFASDQEHLLIIRLDLTLSAKDVDIVQKGLQRLCNLFERINNGEKAIDILNDNGKLERTNLVDRFNFSATIGFGLGFFERLNIPEQKRPTNLCVMPDHLELGDPTPYNLAQTDLIIQLGSNKDQINRWVMENTLQPQENDKKSEDPKQDCPDGVNLKQGQRWCPDGQIIDVNSNEKCTPDIVTAIKGWATITDVHSGFQRQDGRNLMGFNDGVSNPKPCSGSQFDDVVWITEHDNDIKDGTYMVFQKIEHDLDQWRQLSLEEQEEWVGRKKFTGLLKGTLTDEEDKRLVLKLQSPNSQDREEAAAKLKELLELQRNPTKRFYDDDKFKDNVAAWSHIRKANPREELVKKDSKEYRISKHLIFRRGYLFVENEVSGDTTSGLLFVCFQKNIKEGFEFIKKEFLNNMNFPVPEKRDFTSNEIKEGRNKHGRYSVKELNDIKNRDPNYKCLSVIGIENDNDFKGAIEEAQKEDGQNTGREGLAGPSELGVIPSGEFLAIVPLGGGYYFVPPIPDKGIIDIAEQFFRS